MGFTCGNDSCANVYIYGTHCYIVKITIFTCARIQPMVLDVWILGRFLANFFRYKMKCLDASH